MRHSPFLHYLSCLVFALALAGCGNAWKNSPSGSADSFFVLLNKGRYQDAFESASFPFQAQQSLAAFVAKAKDLGVGNYPSRSWTEKSVSKEEAVVNGEFTGDNGAKLLLKVGLIKQSGRWKIFTLGISPDGSNHFVDIFNPIGKSLSFGDQFAREVPNDKDLRALVNDTLREFNEGLHKKNFSDFYADTSALWRADTTKERVAQAFQAFVDAQINIDPYKDAKAVFDEPPRLNAEGMLVVKGYYPTKPNRVIFDLKYTFELPKWKLMSITVSLKE